MHTVDISRVVEPQRPPIQTLYPPSILNEYIKCVVVGDSGVGKTHLITSWACDKNYNLDRLVKTHVSTVWAHDHYRKDPQILERSVVEVDGGCVSLRLWDTFGYHDKDRGFAYRGADVVLLCFSLVQPRSLSNLKTFWIPEIRRRLPATPVVVVGCQADLRYLYRDNTYQRLDKGLMYRVVQEKDIVTPDNGRAVAKEIGAPYYECSVLSRYGVEDVFINNIRAAMVEKRKLRFWSSQLRKIQYPHIQAPMKLPPLLLPKIDVPETSLHADLCSLLDNQSEGDVVLVARGQCFRAHKICLAVSSVTFRNIFVTCDCCVGEVNRTAKKEREGNGTARTDNHGHMTRSISSHSNMSYNSVNVNIMDIDVSNLESCQNINANLNCTQNKPPLSNHPAFLSIEETAYEDPFKLNKTTKQTVITLNNEITPRALQFILEYLYTGSVKEDRDGFAEVKVACSLLQLADLAVVLSNIESAEQYLNVALDRVFRLERKTNLKDIALRREKLADIQFMLDDGIVLAHKPLLIARCEMMYAMFNDNFIEASADTISLPGISRDVFLALREFLYTGECPAGATLNCLGIMEVGNRLCLPRLVRLVEAKVVDDLTGADREGEDILEDVLILLEPAQLHNADLLSDWCMRYLCNHYLQLRQRFSKPLHKLSPDNLACIERNRWPPEWYVKELNYYEHAQMLSLKSKKSKANIQQKHQFSRLEQCTSAAGCLCFCRRSKLTRQDSDFDPVDLPM